MMSRASSSQSKQAPQAPSYATLKQQYDTLRTQHSRLQTEQEHLKAASEKHITSLKSLQDKTVDIASLQRKLEDLEKVHYDGKKTHLVELERIKIELDRSQKTCNDQSERITHLKKQHDTAEARNQDLKKSVLAGQSEIKSIKHKLRIVEQERDQIAAKQNESTETKRALYTAESKHKEEVRERDRKIAELQKALETEKQKAAVALARAEVHGANAEKDTKAVQASLHAAVRQAEETQTKMHNTETAYDALKLDFETMNDTRLQQLDQLNSTIRQVAAEYGRLASSTVASTVHSEVKLECVSLRMRVARLERKLANSDEQVHELVNLFRQCQETNTLLSSCLQDMESLHPLSSVPECPEWRERPYDDYSDMLEELYLYTAEIRCNERAEQQALFKLSQGLCHLYIAQRQQIQLLYQSAEQDLVDGSTIQAALTHRLAEADDSSAKLAAERKMLREGVERLEKERDAQACQVSLTQTQLQLANERMTEMETRAKVERCKADGLLKNEREINHRLVSTVQQNKVKEESMQAEIEQLSSELIDAERYQEAYQNLVEEMGSLVDRNALAEEEAARLSKFNAEILGHRNPTQRIFYVDKIRRELADTKQKLLMSTREHDAVMDDNDALRDELRMYKSVAVPFEGKPRTMITRVARLPLASRSVNSNLPQNGISDELDKHLPQIGNEMTLDEIM